MKFRGKSRVSAKPCLMLVSLFSRERRYFVLWSQPYLACVFPETGTPDEIFAFSVGGQLLVEEK